MKRAKRSSNCAVRWRRLPRSAPPRATATAFAGDLRTAKVMFAAATSERHVAFSADEPARTTAGHESPRRLRRLVERGCSVAAPLATAASHRPALPAAPNVEELTLNAEAKTEGLSPELLAHFPKLCRPRKKHQCRLCAGDINVGEPCCRWSGLVPGEGYSTSHAHPECYQVTLDGKWDAGDWECAQPGDITRPTSKTRGFES